jgi:hypothetical protein
MSTLASHRAQIRKAIGVDIVRDEPVIEVLPLAQIFARDNILPDFPRWASSYPAVGFGIPAPQRHVTASVQHQVRSAPAMHVAVHGGRLKLRTRGLRSAIHA